MTPMDAVTQAFARNRGTLEKWLAYPRYLQQEYGINPVLAGGCIRDLLLGQEPKDLDLFVSMSDWRISGGGYALARSTLDVIAKREGWTLDEEAHPYPIPGSLISVWTHTEEAIPYPYQITTLDKDTSAADLVSQFDFGINMVGVNTYGALALSAYFLYDVENHHITIRNERSRERTLARYERISKKYQVPLVTAEGVELEKPFGGLILPAL